MTAGTYRKAGLLAACWHPVFADGASAPRRVVIATSTCPWRCSSRPSRGPLCRPRSKSTVCDGDPDAVASRISGSRRSRFCFSIKAGGCDPDGRVPEQFFGVRRFPLTDGRLASRLRVYAASSRGTARREAETGYRQPDDLGRRGPAAGAAVTQQRAAFQETFLNACQTETVR